MTLPCHSLCLCSSILALALGSCAAPPAPQRNHSVTVNRVDLELAALRRARDLLKDVVLGLTTLQDQFGQITNRHSRVRVVRDVLTSIEKMAFAEVRDVTVDEVLDGLRNGLDSTTRRLVGGLGILSTAATITAGLIKIRCEVVVASSRFGLVTRLERSLVRIRQLLPLTQELLILIAEQEMDTEARRVIETSVRSLTTETRRLRQVLLHEQDSWSKERR